MPQQVCMGAILQCSFGLAPTPLIVIPKGPPVLAGGMLAATIMDFIPIVNIPTFGLCRSPSNPVVIAGILKLGVLTPMPCIPVTTPWYPGAIKVKINGLPALPSTSMCNCAWAGIIKVVIPGQFIVNIQ